MKRSSFALGAGLALCVAPILTGCGDREPHPPEVEPEVPAALAFTGATLWDGTGMGVVEDAVLVVRGGRVEGVGAAGEVAIPDDARRHDVTGRWIVPGLINAHGHVGEARGMESGAAAHTRENILDQLHLYARYGVTTVVSLGEPGFEGVGVAREQREPAGAGRLDRARLFVAGTVMNPSSPDEARAQVEERVRQGVDWAKIRVDDGLGAREAMPPEIYGAVAEAAQEAGLPLTVHIYRLEDAKGVVLAGADVVGHSVRDRAVDPDLIALMMDRGVCLHPTLTREVSAYVYRSRPDFFDDPFFLRSADPEVLARLQEPEVQARYTGRAADWYRDQLPVATANLMALHRGGVPIALATDSGVVARFQGYFEHMEIQMMQEAGMSPEAILLAATSVAADCMRLDGVGRLVPGAWADFMVVRGDPLVDVRNLREIDEVRVGGNAVEGARFVR